MAFLMIAGCATRQASVNTNFRRDYPAPSPSPTIDEVARRQAENSRRLNDNIVEYARLPSSSQMTGRPYINGRAIGLSKDPEDKEFELDRSLLDDNLTAESPEEVGTVVLVTYRKQKFGTYITDNSERLPGYVMLADLIIVDRSIPAMIYKKTFRGGRPEDLVDLSRYETEVVGDSPSDKVTEFLGKLPRH